MTDRATLAAERKRSGKYNCAQAVVCTFSDLVGVDEATLMKMGNAFAAGMGTMDGTCGALVGAGMVIGMTSENMPASLRRMRAVMNGFAARNGTTVCRELKGVDTGVVLRECPLCVADAVEEVEMLRG